MKRGMHTAVSRRRLLQGAAAGLFGAAGAAVLAACGETQVVTKEVIKEVPVERVVTKEVIKEVPVERVVTKEVIKEVVVERVVTQEVIKEVMVTAAPAMEQEMTGPVSGGTITVGAGTPSTRFWNPYAQWGSEHHFINDYVWLQLWYGDQWGDGRLPALPGGWGPGAAQSWDEIEPSRVYDFHLHPDLNWHDGAPVIADDVVWSYQMAIDPAYGAKFADITYINIQGSQAWAENPTDNVEDSGGVVKIDDKTVRVSLENPNPGWWGRPLKDRSVHLPPYPKHLYKDIDPATAFEGHAAGLSARRERGLEGRALRRGPVLGTGSQRRLCVWGTLHRPLHHPLRRPRRERRGHRGRRVGPHPCGHRGVVRALG